MSLTAVRPRAPSSPDSWGAPPSAPEEVVEVPAWRRTVADVVAPVLPDLDPDALPTDAAGVARFGAALAGHTDADAGTVGRDAARAIVGVAALAAGWSPIAPGPVFRRGPLTVDLLGTYDAVVAGAIPPGAWAAACRRTGLVGPMHRLATPPAPLPRRHDGTSGRNRPVVVQPSGCEPAAMGPTAAEAQPSPPVPDPTSTADPARRARRGLTYRARLRTGSVGNAARVLVIHGDVLTWGTEWVRAGDVVALAYDGPSASRRSGARFEVTTATGRVALRLRPSGRDAAPAQEAYAALRRWAADVVEPMLVAGIAETVATFGRAEVAGALLEAEGVTAGGAFVPWSSVASVALDGDAVVITRHDLTLGVALVARLGARTPNAVLLPALAARLTAGEHQAAG